MSAKQIRHATGGRKFLGVLPPEVWATFSDADKRYIRNMGYLPGVVGAGSPVGAVSPAGLPAAAGGVDVSGSLTSVVPGIRKLKRIGYSTQLPAGFKGGKIPIPLPKASYLHKAVIRVTGNLQIVQPGGGAVTLTAGDLRSFVDRIEFAMSGATSPRVLNGIQHDVIDGMDVPAIAPNASSLATLTPGAAGSTTPYAYVQEFSPIFCVSDQNLYGIPYLGALATVPQITLTFKDPSGSLVTPGGGGTTITFENGLVEVELWRVDLPGPVAPQAHQVTVNGQQQTVETPGQGLYLESSYLLLTKVQDSQDLTAAGTYKKFKLPIGPDYLRVLVMVYNGGVLDPETTPLLDHAELVVQQATTIESKKPWQFSNEYRRLFNKARPAGVYVFSGIDSTGTDADIYVSRELGNFDVDVYGSAVVPPANSRAEVVTQQLVPLSVPGEYL